MGMRDYENLKDLVIPEEREKIMDIFCAAWDDCRNMGHCEDCPDRQMLKEKFSLLECFSLKYSRMLIEAGCTPVVHGEWERILCDEDAYEHHRCSICKEYARFSYLDETVFDENSDGEMEECGTVTVDIIEDLTPFCPLCGAKMEGVRNEEACR